MQIGQAAGVTRQARTQSRDDDDDDDGATRRCDGAAEEQRAREGVRNEGAGAERTDLVPGFSPRFRAWRGEGEQRACGRVRGLGLGRAHLSLEDLKGG